MKDYGPRTIIFAGKLVPAARSRHALSMRQELVTGRSCMHTASRVLRIAALCVTSALVSAGEKLLWAISDLLGDILPGAGYRHWQVHAKQNLSGALTWWRRCTCHGLSICLLLPVTEISYGKMGRWSLPFVTGKPEKPLQLRHLQLGLELWCRTWVTEEHPETFSKLLKRCEQKTSVSQPKSLQIQD